jgi:phosphate transport system substrate-binding protein
MKNLMILSAAMGLLAATACTSHGQKLVIKGSNTFGEELAPALIKGFAKKNASIHIELESKGSGSGIAALLDGTAEIAASSRPMTEDELRLAQSRGLTIDQHVVGYYGITIIVHEGNPVKALSDREVAKLFSGKITRWNTVGGPDEGVVVYTPNPEHGTYLGFQELAMFHSPYADSALPKGTYTEVHEAVAADPFGIGFVSINMASEKGTKGMIINGIHPSNIAVVEQLYPYARQVRLFTNRDAVSAATKKFIRFVQSRDGQRIVEKTGFVPRIATPMDLGGLGP